MLRGPAWTVGRDRAGGTEHRWGRPGAGRWKGLPMTTLLGVEEKFKNKIVVKHAHAINILEIAQALY